MLGKIADFYEDEVDQAVTSLTALLEPMMMVFLGVMIGFIVIAMYLPIFTWRPPSVTALDSRRDDASSACLT